MTVRRISKRYYCLIVAVDKLLMPWLRGFDCDGISIDVRWYDDWRSRVGVTVVIGAVDDED
jgi:hypothetical protein